MSVGDAATWAQGSHSWQPSPLQALDVRRTSSRHLRTFPFGELDIQEYTDPEHDPMIPHTLVLKPGLVIHSVYNGYWFWGRPSFYDLWQDLRAATAEIRPDWDLGAPGLREAWDAGDYSKFHGWDRKAAKTMPTSYT